MKNITTTIICLGIIALSGCTNYKAQQIKKQMRKDRIIMIQNPVLTEQHSAARQRYNRNLQELVRLGYFQKEVIPLKNIKQDSPNAEKLWDELREGMDITNDLGEVVWSPADRYDSEQFIVWDTPEKLNEIKIIIKKHDVPETKSGQQIDGSDS